METVSPTAPTPEMVDRTFASMGSTCRVVTDGPAGSADAAIELVAELDSRWSRFRATSEISRLNANAGHPTIVSKPTFDLIDRACLAWERTSGVFDPTMLHQLERHGYDRHHNQLTAAHSPVSTYSRAPAPAASQWSSQCGDIEMQPALRSVTLPKGCAIDPGGIGKGYGADLALELLLEHGASWAMVSLGGDMRLGGDRLAAEGWDVVVEDPFSPGCAATRLRTFGGGVASSSRLRRRWNHGGQDRHHLLDPRTGSPAETANVAATVLAGEAWWAEVIAKVIVIDEHAYSRLSIDRWESRAVVFGQDRTHTVVNGMPLRSGEPRS